MSVIDEDRGGLTCARGDPGVASIPCLAKHRECCHLGGMSQAKSAKPATRSAVTNGTRLLEGVDQRSPAARRFRDLVTAYCDELNSTLESLSESQRSTV